MIYLVEHFFSIQGEGKYTGVPSLFFRFGGCNLTCEGFGCQEHAPDGTLITGCDTLYAVNREHFSTDWQKVHEVETLLQIMQSYTLPSKVDVVFTGGEPLLYADDPMLVQFLAYLDAKGHRITFETNGAVRVPFDAYPIYRQCIYALSIKLSNSGEAYKKRVKPDIFMDIAHQARESFFKFTVDQAHLGTALEQEIHDITAYLPNEPVYCMPLGGSKAEVEANTEAVIAFCKRMGYRYSDRLHIRIWDSNKGV
jgi:7-carboxy-7-deazaguanine synthase